MRLLLLLGVCVALAWEEEGSGGQAGEEGGEGSGEEGWQEGCGEDDEDATDGDHLEQGFHSEKRDRYVTEIFYMPNQEEYEEHYFDEEYEAEEYEDILNNYEEEEEEEEAVNAVPSIQSPTKASIKASPPTLLNTTRKPNPSPTVEIRQKPKMSSSWKIGAEPLWVLAVLVVM